MVPRTGDGEPFRARCRRLPGRTSVRTRPRTCAPAAAGQVQARFNRPARDRSAPRNPHPARWLAKPARRSIARCGAGWVRGGSPSGAERCPSPSGRASPLSAFPHRRSARRAWASVPDGRSPAGVLGALTVCDDLSSRTVPRPPSGRRASRSEAVARHGHSRWGLATPGSHRPQLRPAMWSRPFDRTMPPWFTPVANVNACE